MNESQARMSDEEVHAHFHRAANAVHPEDLARYRSEFLKVSLTKKAPSKTASWGGLVGDAVEFLAELAARSRGNPEAAKQLLKKELSGQQLGEDVGKFTTLLREKGLGGTIAHGATGVADLWTRRSHEARPLGAMALGYTLPYTAHATKERLNDPEAGPFQRYMGAGSELLLNPLSTHPNIGFTTAALMNTAGPEAVSQVGRGLDKVLGLRPKQSSAAHELLYLLAKTATARVLSR